jgi:hypothetical protein
MGDLKYSINLKLSELLIWVYPLPSPLLKTILGTSSCADCQAKAGSVERTGRGAHFSLLLGTKPAR